MGIVSGMHFAEKGFVSHASWLGDEEYSKMLDNIVFVGVDVALVHNRKMLLGKRAVYPQRDWWVIGGRMRPGESFEEAASRNLARELGLSIEPQRFMYLCTLSYVFSKRQQSPQENGTHAVGVTMLLEISGGEERAICHNEEYEMVKWEKLDKVAFNTSLHPAVNVIARNVLEKMGLS